MSRGRFGDFGGQYVPETLMTCLLELEAAYEDAKKDPDFDAALNKLHTDYSGRPTPLYHATNYSQKFGGGARIYLKRSANYMVNGVPEDWTGVEILTQK